MRAHFQISNTTGTPTENQLVHYYYNCEYLLRFLACVSFPLHQSAPSLFLKSNFEYLRGNYRKAVKLLNSSNVAEHPGPIKTGDNYCDFQQ